MNMNLQHDITCLALINKLGKLTKYCLGNIPSLINLSTISGKSPELDLHTRTGMCDFFYP